MIEPLSIVGFTFGAIGFLFTVRNVIEKSLHEVDRFKRDHERLISTSARLTTFTDRIDIWRTFWHVQDGAPEHLFIAYWGESGSSQVLNLLASIHRQCRAIHKEFSALYPDVDWLLGHHNTPLDDDVWFEEAEIENLRQLSAEYKQRTSTLKRLNNAAFRDGLFEGHMESLSRSIDLLEELSEKRFVSNAMNRDGRGWEAYVERTALRVHLVDLADSTKTVSEALRKLFVASTACHVDFPLSLGSSPEQRSPVVSEFSRKQRLKYRFWIYDERSAPQTICEVEVTPVSSKLELARSVATSRALNFQDAVAKVVSRRADDSRKITFKDSTTSRSYFSMNRVSSDVERPDSLRSFISATPGEFRQRLHGDFLKWERTQLAYELVECALIFLGTEWFNDICSCSLRRGTGSDIDARYAIRLGNVQHVEPGSGEFQEDTRQWCQEDLTAMHIRRLGVLLVEIATGAAVIDASLNKKDNRVEIDFELDLKWATVGESPPGASLAEISYRVQKEAGKDFRDAIKYCLEQGITPESVDKSYLESFHDNVVAP